MQIKPKRSLFWSVASHLAMGASLGGFFALFLIALNAQHVFDMIISSSTPAVTLVTLLSVFASLFWHRRRIAGLIFILYGRKLSRCETTPVRAFGFKF